MKYKAIKIVIPIILLVGITTFIHVRKVKGQRQGSVSGLYSISIKDIDEIDKYPEVKEFLLQNGHYEKLEKVVKELEISASEHDNKGKLDKEIESVLIEKYSLEQPTQTKLNNTGITIIIEYRSNKIINDVQIKKDMND
jgi:hypothetical protein